jgi:hypothetical protein
MLILWDEINDESKYTQLHQEIEHYPNRIFILFVHCSVLLVKFWTISAFSPI